MGASAFDKDCYKAAGDGDVAAVKKAIEAGADIDYTHGTNMLTPLIIASINGHIEVVKVLLAAGADKHNQCSYGNTAESYAIQNFGQGCEIQKLLK